MLNFTKQSRHAPALAVALLLLPQFAGQAFAQTANATAADVFSFVRSLRLAAVPKLPKAPVNGGSKMTAKESASSQSDDQDQDCVQSPEIQPKTVAGQQVQASGWHVTAEEKIGPYLAVSFAGNFKRGTSGSCTVGQGNIGIYSGTKLVAIAYATRSSGLSISRLVPLEDRELRIWSGDIYMWEGDIHGEPIADLIVHDDGSLRLAPVAAGETFCHGTVRVPNIYSQPIDRARKALIAAGWTPKPTDKDLLGVAVGGLVERGIPEVETCSMGFVFCQFNYTAAAGTLQVTTQGELDLPAVVGYAVSCGNEVVPPKQ